MHKKRKKLISVIVTVLLIAAGIFSYFHFFTYSLDRIDANSVKKIVYMEDKNIDPNKFVRREITDPQDIKNFLAIYRGVIFKKSFSPNHSPGFNPDVNIYGKDGRHEISLDSGANYLFNGADLYRYAFAVSKYAEQAKAIADKYPVQSN